MLVRTPNFLLYEYLENQSLDKWLHGKKKTSPSGLSWPTRLNIAIGVAQGLYYMHHECSPPVIHRDVKSSNILLDSEFKAKIADFGLAKMLANLGEPHTMSALAGSFGYIPPGKRCQMATYNTFYIDNELSWFLYASLALQNMPTRQRLTRRSMYIALGLCS